jgi:NADPH:quinone reductase-like Zn-dependent oxidoreductase
VTNGTVGLPRTMRAVVLTGHGGLDVLKYVDDWPTPVPAPDDVIVRVGACGLNNTDINTRTAWYSKSVKEGVTEGGGKTGYASADADAGSWGRNKLQFPLIQGADVCGTIAAVGSRVDPKRLGERILIDPWLLKDVDWMDADEAPYFGSEMHGGYAEFAKIRARNAIPVVSSLTDAELATFPCSYGTAENLVTRAGVSAGDIVVIAGASGGVGSASIQLCRLRNATVIAIAAPGKAQQLRELGAEHVIDRNEQDLATKIVSIAGRKIDVALDVVGGRTFIALIDALRQGGRCGTSGAISGPVIEFDLRQIIYKDLVVSGATIVPPGTLQKVIRYIEAGKLKPVLARTYPLRDLAKAQEEFMAKRHVGNIVVIPEHVA